MMMMPLIDSRALAASGVGGSAGAALSVTTDTVPFKAKSANSARSTLLKNQPSALATSNWTVETTFSPMSNAGAIKRSGSRMKLGVECVLKAIKKPEKTGRRSKVLLSPGKIEIKILVLFTAASTADASTGTSSTHDAPVVEVDGDGALTIPPCFSLDQDGASGL